MCCMYEGALQNPEEESVWAAGRALERVLLCLCLIDYPVDRCTVQVLLQKTPLNLCSAASLLEPDQLNII